MATQVEVSASLASLANIGELRNEATLQHAFVSSLSDTSSKAGDHPGPLSPLILEERNKFGSPLRPSTMPPAASRPRLTPRPFSRERSLETFTVVKPPIPALKPSPNPSALARTSEDTAAAKGLTGNVPPLLDQKLIENKSPRELVANMPFYPSPQANTVILFETGSNEKGKVKVTPENTSGTSHVKQEQLSSSKSEASYRKPEGAGIHRQLSLSTESRPVSWTPRKSLERKDTFSGADDIDKEQNRVSEVQLRPKQRPVSAIFLESLKDHKQGGADVSDETKPVPEKPWVRKPRPLSMDLTAKFENPSLQRKSCLPESRETAGLSTVDSSKSNPKGTPPVADCVESKAAAHIQKSSPEETSPLGRNAPKDVSQVSARDRKYLWEVRLKSQDEQNEREVEVAETSEKTKGPSPKERTVLNPKEPRFSNESCAGAPEVQSKTSKGLGVKKPTEFPDSLANGSSPMNDESLPESSGKETRVLNIQQRIKELTADSADAKPGSLRRSFRSRPLSSDLTKLFSAPLTAADGKPERQAEPTRKPVSEAQDIQEKERTSQCGAEAREAHGAGIPRDSQDSLKATLADERPERDGSSVKGRQSAPVPPGDSPASVSVHNVKTHPAAPPENVGVKTVRATMFEHNVERHTVAASHLGTEPKSQPTSDPVAGLLGHFREPWVERILDPKVPPRKVPSGQANIPVDAEKSRKPRPVDEDKTLQATAWEKHTLKERYEKASPKPVEDSFMYQRIEPRYEILQMVGERVQSEAIMMVPEDKAVTLRSRRPLKERRRTDGSLADATWARSLDVQGDGWKEEAFVPKAKDSGEVVPRTTLARELKASSHEQVTEENKNWPGQQQAATRASYFANRNKDWGRTEDKVSKLSAETEQRREVVLGGKMTEGSGTPKHFPEGSGGKPDRTDGCEARASVEKSTSVKGEHENQPTAPRTSRWQASIRRTSTHLSGDPGRTGERDESKVVMAHGAQEESDVPCRRPKGDGLQERDEDERTRRSGAGISAPKSMERWRRKTLPHDAFRFEDAGVLSQERKRSPSRRDSFQLWDASVAKRTPKPTCGGELREGRAGPPSSPESDLKKQPSPSKPKETCFAVTYQPPDENKSALSTVPDPLKNKDIPSLAADASVPPSARAAKTPHLANGSHGKRFSDAQGSLDRPLSRDGGEGDASEIPQRGPFRYPLAEARNDSQNWAKERVTDVDFPPHGSGTTKSPSHLRPLHQDSKHPGQKKGSDQSHGPSTEKATDGYRSRVLDLDMLMAEYKEDTQRASLVQGKRGGSLPADGTPCSFAHGDPRRTDLSPGGKRQEISAAEPSVNEREVLESYSQEPSPLRARDVKFSPPRWGRQVVEKPKGSPVDPTSTRKKTFLVDEDHGEGLVLWHQSAKHASCRTQVGGPVCVDVEPGVGFAPPASRPHAEGASWKSVRVKRERDALKEADQRAGVNLNGVGRRKAGASEGSCSNDGPSAQSGPESGPSVPGLANALPDLRRSYSEKVRQSRARSSGFPFGPVAREKVEDQSGVRQSFPPESSDSRLSRRSASPHSVFLSEGKKLDVEKDGTKPGREEPRNSPCVPIQQRSRSFYKDRKTDQWPTDRLKRCFGRPAADAKDTDTLVRDGDNQYGTWQDQPDGADSFVPESPSSESVSAPARKPGSGGSRLSSFSSQTDPASTADPPDSSRDRRSASLDCYSTDTESADGTEPPAPPGASPDFSFFEQTPVLDSSALKTRVQLSKRRRQRRAPISHSLRRSGGREEGQPGTPGRREADSTWMFRDSTGEKPSRREDSDEEGRPRPTERPPAPQPQRLPVFPGMDHSALKAQLRKRHEPEGTRGGAGGPLAPSPRAPKSPFPAGALPGARMLPTGTEKEERSEEASPQWLKDLKSKKRQSQCENQV